MESSPYGAPTPGAATSRPPTDPLEALVKLAHLGLSKDEILSLSKLSLASVSALLDVFEEEGRKAVEDLLQSLGRLPKEHAQVDRVGGSRGESGRGRLKSRPPVPIDNKRDASTATSTSRLQPPISLRTTRTRSTSSASTNLTQPSLNKRLKAAPRTTARKQLYCPDCRKEIKNAFEKHFKDHLKDLLDQKVGDRDLIGCGYCPCDLHSLQFGRACYGEADLLGHIREHHAQVNSSEPVRLQWDFNASFKNLLMAEGPIRRYFLVLVDEENKQIAGKTPPHNVPPTLSWPLSSGTRSLLNALQTLGGEIAGVPFTHRQDHNNFELRDLLGKAYDAAHKWQPPPTQLTGALLHHSAQTHAPQPQLTFQQAHPVPSPAPPPPPNLQNPVKEDDNFAVGQQFDNLPDGHGGNQIHPMGTPSPFNLAPNGPALAPGTLFQGNTAELDYGWGRFVNWDYSN